MGEDHENVLCFAGTLALRAVHPPAFRSKKKTRP